MTTYQTENKEQRLMIIIVPGKKYYLAFLKDQFLVHFFLRFSLRKVFLVLKDIDIASDADDSAPFIVENNTYNV